MSKRVAVYARVSTTRQAENDISIPDQLAQARRFSEGRGWIVIREFVDAGASARDDKRHEFQRLLGMACTDPSPFDVVLVHSQSRFFRDTAGYVFSKRKLEKHGVSLVSMTQEFGKGPSADFAETIIAASDALSSAENAKHTSRSMIENARQGFWNGSVPPFGYRTMEAEKRGQRTKKRLEIEEREAALVRQVFKLFLEGDGTKGSMGIKAIVSWLNTHGFRNRNGNSFYTSAVHQMLARSAYSGTYYYNTSDSRANKPRPKSEWTAVTVPQIIPVQDFNRAQELLRARDPRVTPPRITTSEVLLTGLVQCETCGSAMLIRTGTSETGKVYRYYACAGHRLKGRTACGKPMAIPESQLDDLVVSALADQLLTPARLPELLNAAIRYRHSVTSEARSRKAALEKQRKDIDGQIERLLTAVAEGTLPDLLQLRAKIDDLTARRSECTRLLASLDSADPKFRQTLSRQQAVSVAETLKRKLLNAAPALKRYYVRALVSTITVDKEKAVISGPPAAIAAAVTAPDQLGEVRSSVRQWRPREDSNFRPSV